MEYQFAWHFYIYWLQKKPEINVERAPKESKVTKKEKAAERNRLYQKKTPIKKKLNHLETRLEKIMTEKDNLDKTLASHEIYKDSNKEKLLETLSQHKKLGSEENELIEEIERLTQDLERVS